MLDNIIVEIAVFYYGSTTLKYKKSTTSGCQHSAVYKMSKFLHDDNDNNKNIDNTMAIAISPVFSESSTNKIHLYFFHYINWLYGVHNCFQCTYPYFLWAPFTSTPHTILSKLLAAFYHTTIVETMVSHDRGWILLKWISSSLWKKLAKPRIKPATLCSQVLCASHWDRRACRLYHRFSDFNNKWLQFLV